MLSWSPSQRRRVRSTFFDHLLSFKNIIGRSLLVKRELVPRDNFGSKLLLVGMATDATDGVTEDIDVWLRWCTPFLDLTFFTGMGSSSILIAVTVV